MEKTKLLSCPICGKEIDEEKDMYIPERDWKPTFYDPDSGGDPMEIHCECGLQFCVGYVDWEDFAKAWNTRKPVEKVLKNMESFKKAWEEESVKNYPPAKHKAKSWNKAIELVKCLLN